MSLSGNQVYKQTQNGETIEYALDPEGRTRETISTGKTSGTVISHYDGSGAGLAWTSESSEKWTRNIPGIDGALTAVQTNTGIPVLQLHDLQGNVVATVGDSETETKLLTKYNSTEFGVPTTKEPPPKYSWLGAVGVADELPSGVLTRDGVTYVPQTGRPLQTEGVALPAPENAVTPFSRPVEAWVGSKAGEGTARELSRAEQERHTRENANTPPGVIPAPGGGESEDEGGWEEGDSGAGGGLARVAGYNQRNPNSCRVWTSWGHFWNNRLGVFGHYQCLAIVGAGSNVIEVCLMQYLHGELKHFECGKAADRHQFGPDMNEGSYPSNGCVLKMPGTRRGAGLVKRVRLARPYGLGGRGTGTQNNAQQA